MQFSASEPVALSKVRRSKPRQSLLHSHVRLSDGAAKFLVLLAKKSGKIGPANAGGVQPLDRELRLDVRHLQGRHKPPGNLGDDLFRRPCRRDHSKPVVDRKVRKATVVAVFSARVAAGEEIGWRGYMLTRLIDAGVPRPVLVNGVIWGLWHVPLILGGVYLAGPPPIVSALLWMVVAISVSFVFARLRLTTGSIWPAIALHAAWNSIVQVAFDQASTGPGATLWVGESGILVMLTTIAAAVVFARGWWTVRRFPEVSRDDPAAAAPPQV
jgi:hypothetical protein